MERKVKRVSESRAEHVQIIYEAHINGAGRLFGGRLMEWIDTVGAVTARRHAGTEVTTAAIGRLEFHAAAPLGSTVVLVAEMTFTGTTSMEVRVDTYVERLSDMHRELVNKAYLIYVALGADGKPVPVPGILIETPKQAAEFEAGRERKRIYTGR